MKSRKLLFGSALVFASFFAIQAYAATAPTVSAASSGTSIANSKHDLSAASSSTGVKGTLTEVCVYCHTPHGSDNANGPLWNRNAATPSTLTPYTTTSTMDSTLLTTFHTTSAACMSCHDGVTAVDAVVNAPTNGSGYNFNTGATGTSGTTMKLTSIAAVGFNRGTAGTGADLSDDHPIGVAYCGGGFGGTSSGCKDPDFVLGGNGTLGANVSLSKNNTAYVAANVTGTTALTDKFWINTDATATGKSKQDLPLFARAGFGTGGNQGDIQPSVECATCHDVHNPANGTFLRISNAQSALCYACHIK